MEAEERAAQILAGATLGGLDPTDLRRRIAEGIREAVAAEREACALLVEGAELLEYRHWDYNAAVGSYSYDDIPAALEDLARQIRGRGATPS